MKIDIVKIEVQIHPIQNTEAEMKVHPPPPWQESQDVSDDEMKGTRSNQPFYCPHGVASLTDG